MRQSIALLILLSASLITFAGCGGKEDNVVLENPPMPEQENVEEENAGVSGES